MPVSSDTVQKHDRPSLGLPLRHIVRTTGEVHIPPDPEHLVYRVQGVNLELVIRILTCDEDFEIVVEPYFCVTLGQRRPDVRLFSRESEIEVLVVPKETHPGIEPCAFSRDDIYEGC